jgi:hypothetical protein
MRNTWTKVRSRKRKRETGRKPTPQVQQKKRLGGGLRDENGDKATDREKYLKNPLGHISGGSRRCEEHWAGSSKGKRTAKKRGGAGRGKQPGKEALRSMLGECAQRASRLLPGI